MSTIDKQEAHHLRPENLVTTLARATLALKQLPLKPESTKLAVQSPLYVFLSPSLPQIVSQSVSTSKISKLNACALSSIMTQTIPTLIILTACTSRWSPRKSTESRVSPSTLQNSLSRLCQVTQVATIK